MELLARGQLSGHEARGEASVVRGADGVVYLELNNLWVAPGAPDVRVFLSVHPDGKVDSASLDLGHVKDRQASQRWALPADAVLAKYRAVTIYCFQFSVTFGTGELVVS